MRVDAVVKVGGSLIGGRDLGPLLGALGEAAKTRGLVVVPGGGDLADAVRRACAVHDPGPSAAHWMAILAMDQQAHFLASLLPAARVTGNPPGVSRTLAEGLLPVLAPFAWLRAADELPHGWHVTSDSIAAWVAGRLAARRLILLKSGGGVAHPEGGAPSELALGAPALAGIVDEYFEQAVEPGMEVWILAGRYPERLAELLREGRTLGTRVR